jgi:hypothetical protein
MLGATFTAVRSSTSGFNLAQLVANIMAIAAGAYGLYRFLNRAFKSMIAEQIQPVTDALVNHMADETVGMTALIKSQKKFAKTFDRHVQNDLQKGKDDTQQFSEIRRTLAEIQTTQGTP